MSTQIFVNPNASPELIKALDLEALAEYMERPFVFVPDDRPRRPERRAYRERNLKPWERTA